MDMQNILNQNPELLNSYHQMAEDYANSLNSTFGDFFIKSNPFSISPVASFMPIIFSYFSIKGITLCSRARTRKYVPINKR